MAENTALKIPTLSELVAESDERIKDNALMVILNQEPPKAWLKSHPMAKVKKNGVDTALPYLPISRVEYLLSRIYTKWWQEIKSVQCIANSIVVVVRVYVINPISGETEWNDGVGASPIQTDKGAGAMDWNKAKSAGVMMAAPAAESYAFKDAAEKFGKLFGKDLVRDETIDYTSLLKQDKDEITVEDLRELLNAKMEVLTLPEITAYNRILNNNEKASFKRMQTELKSK